MKYRWFYVALALAAAVAFMVSVQLGRWWSIADVEIGPFSSKHCFGGECKQTSLTWTGGTIRWQRTGMGAWAAGCISALTLVCLAAGVAAKRIPDLLAKMVLVSIVTALVTGALFFVQFPTSSGATPDRGLAFFGGAIAVALFVVFSVLRAKPAVPSAESPSVAAPAAADH